MRAEALVDTATSARSEVAAADAAAVPRTRAGLDSGTLLSLLAANAQSHGSTIAMRERDRGIWREFTWKDVLSEVVALAAALDAMG
jgi:long-subunit acyl-CoA synthetase (AMP-forming)